MKKDRWVRPVSILLATMFINTCALDAAPKGKPFVEIQGQFVEVQGSLASIETQIDGLLTSMNTLEGRVTTLESNVATINAAIQSVKDENAAILAQMGSLLTEAAANNSEIQNALAKIEEFNAQIRDLMGSSEANAEAIAGLQDQIDAQQDYISTNAEGYQTLLAKIEANNSLIEGMNGRLASAEEAIALKQSIINAECSQGYSLTKINEDGSFECSMVNAQVDPQFASLGLVNTMVTGGGPIGGTYRVQEEEIRWRTVCHTYCWSGDFLSPGGCSTTCGQESYTAYVWVTYPKTNSSLSISCPAGTLWTYDGGYNLPEGVSLSAKNLTTTDSGNFIWTYDVYDPSATEHYMSVSAQCVHPVDPELVP